MKRIVVLILTLVFCNQLKAQGDLPNDAENALTVCGSETFVSNAQGKGDDDELTLGCGGFGEFNSLWLKVTIVQAGTLGFNIIPNDPDIKVDYDFYIYGPNKPYNALGSPLRCCTTNPEAAGLTSNVTGMNGTESSTTGGPNGNGNGFVRWLDVAVGETYYISIARPIGDGGFTLDWIGSATDGNGAFPIPPTINNIPDLVACGSNPGYGIFSFDATFKSTINADPFNEVHIYRTQKDAIDDFNKIDDPLINPFGIYVNEIPYNQKVYTRVTNLISGCFSIDDFNLIVSDLPTVSMTLSSSEICLGESVDVIFKGTPNATVEYRINNATPNLTAVLDNNGDFVLVDTPIVDTSYRLMSASIIDASGITSCKTGYGTSAPKTITVNPLPTATIVGKTDVCEGSTSQVTLSGTPDATVEYTIDGVTGTVILDPTGNAVVTTPVLIANSTFVLVSVTTAGTNASPTATISGTTTVCQNSTNPEITFTGAVGSPPYEFTYTVNSGPSQTITTTSGNSVTISVPTAVLGDFIYELVSVSYANTPFCGQTQTGTATVSVISLPTVTISGPTSPICSNTTTQITFKGTPNAIVDYTVDGVAATITLDAAGNATLTTPPLLNNSSYDLVSVTLPGSTVCSQPQTGNVLITVTPYSIITATPSTESICSGSNTNITLSSNKAGTTYAWTANATGVNGASNGTGNKIIQNLTTTANSSGTVTYTVTATTNGCVELPIDVVVNVSPKPVATATPNQALICSGEKTNISLTGDIAGTTFSWTVVQTNATGALAGNGNTIAQTLTATNLNKGIVTYTITPDNNGCIGLPITVVVEVNPIPVATYTSATGICNLEATNIALSSALSGTTFTWIANATGVSGASAGTGTDIIQVLTLTGEVSGKVIYTVTPINNGCNGQPVDITIIVEQLPRPNIADGTICVDLDGNPIQTYTLDTGLDNATYNFEWYFEGNIISGATNNTYTATEIGNYGVIATHSTLGCVSLLDTATVNESVPGKSLTLSQNAYFSDNAMIYATVEGGNGNYIYQLDNGPFQASNVFTNVQPGQHTVTVNDTNGCTNLSADIYIIGYPKFFTPNGDGYNDTWDIKATGNLVYKKIIIYDRYGKLLIQLNPNSNGWDGRFNGQNLPSTDYWFVFDYTIEGEDQVLRAHFSLKR